MKILIVYYSYDGNTRAMAEVMAGAIGADRLEIRPRDEKKRTGLSKFLWGGMAVMSGKQPELMPLEKDPGQYDVLIVGSPVWAGTYAPPMRSFFAQTRLIGKKIALFCCCGGGKGRIFSAMRAALAGNEILAEQVFVEPLKRHPAENANVAAQWAQVVLGCVSGSSAKGE